MSVLTSFRVSDEQKRKYQEDGFFILDRVIAERDLETLRSECAELIAAQDREMDRLGVNELNLSRRNSRYFVFLAYKERRQLGEFIFSGLMAEICKATIGENAMLFWEQFVVKGTEKAGSEFGWHQDSGYVDYKHKPYVNAWIPLDDVDEENGTIYLLPYSVAGTREKVEHKPLPNSNDRVGYFGNEPGIAAICKAGSIVVFSSTVFHRSGPNLTNKMRRAYAIQYSPEPILEADGSLKGLAEDFLKNGKRVR
ncbi:MAG: phytanoyl-CoA dioxygenase family protein [Bacteroidota bacterium]|nr:phytanoyl-CoA dioxygenase family protein [Bacteroidota bacterium]